jgi:hypothetical protein
MRHFNLDAILPVAVASSTNTMFHHAGHIVGGEPQSGTVPPTFPGSGLALDQISALL